MSLSTLFALALVELEDSSDAADVALLQRLRAGTHTARDADDLVGLMACLADEQDRLAAAAETPARATA